MWGMKLPHWAILLVSALTVVVAWVIQQSVVGNLVLPAVVLTVLPLISAALGILSPSVNNTTNVVAATKYAFKQQEEDTQP